MDLVLIWSPSFPFIFSLFCSGNVRKIHWPPVMIWHFPQFGFFWWIPSRGCTRKERKNERTNERQTHRQKRRTAKFMWKYRRRFSEYSATFCNIWSGIFTEVCKPIQHSANVESGAVQKLELQVERPGKSGAYLCKYCGSSKMLRIWWVFTCKICFDVAENEPRQV